ncbi:MAG: DUF1156 domain-containing protein [Desulfurococcales archaeon]|nr:DUF1156 domain-containing protein [Desulfurococcales archaeon]
MVAKKLIEARLPVNELNNLSSKEAGFIRIPKIHNLHTWFARRPAGPSRVLTLASILPSTVESKEIEKATGMLDAIKSKKVIYYISPKREKVNELTRKYLNKSPSEIVVVDPMAGGGSLPLESLRLGFKTIAIDYNPVAYLVTRATVEFPAKYADSGLFEETLRAAKEFINKAREELGKYYGRDAKRYIFARGVKCPFCGGLIPIQGVSPVITKATRFKNRYLKIQYDKERKIFHIETVDKEPGKPYEKRGYNIKCPYCGRWFQLRGRAKTGTTAFDKWFLEHAELMRRVVEEYEEVTPELEDRLLSTHIPLVKQVGNKFIAIWDDEERERFLQAYRDLSREILELQDYIPLDPISSDNKWASTARNKGLTHWYMLYNPRQLLALAKLSKIVAETAEKLASSNGEFGAAVALYLAFAIDKTADYNTIATKWQGSSFKTGIGNTMRGESTLDFRQEYTEMGFNPPELSIDWALEANIAESTNPTRTAGGILPVLWFLVEEFSGSGLGDRVSVYLGDATKLSSILGVGSVDVVNVDPPYFEQVIYSDRSEFFWVILRRSLRPVLELLFKDRVMVPGWSWSSPRVPREHEVVTYDKRDSSGRFKRFFSEFMKETYKVLRNDGVLVLWFTHPTDVAWKTVGESLYKAGYVVSRVWPIKTEMKTRYKGQVNVVAQETSLIIVGRKYERRRLVEIGADVRRSLLENPAFWSAAREAVEESRRVARDAGASPADMMALMLGTALSVASRFEVPGLDRFEPLFDVASTLVDEAFVMPIIDRILRESGPVKLSNGDAVRVSELVSHAMLRDPATRSFVTLWFVSRIDLESGKYRDEPLPLSYDFAQTIAKMLGYDIDRLKDVGLVGEKLASSNNDEEGKSRAFYPVLFEALTAASAKTSWDRLSKLTPGRAIYLVYLALNETGAPGVRAKNILRRVREWGNEGLRESAALAVLLLETARGADLGIQEARTIGLEKYLYPGADSSEVSRELAVLTLLKLVKGEVG